MMPPLYLVPLDGSLRTLAALSVARSLGGIESGTVLAMHVTDEALAASEMTRRLGLDREELRGTVVEVHPGNPAEAILRVARERQAAVLVMCTHTAKPRAVGFLGATAAAVLRDAPCPVVIVPTDLDVASWSLENVLLPHDGTPTTSAAIGRATELARKAGANLHLLHVAAPGGASAEPGSFSSPRYVDQRQHEWPAWAGEFLERFVVSCPMDVSLLRLSLARGDPGSEIVRFATVHPVDLIVLAWRGASDPGRARVVREVLRGAPCPVMVLRTEPPISP